MHMKNVFKCRPQEFFRNALSVCYVPVCGHWPVDIMHYYTDVCVVNDKLSVSMLKVGTCLEEMT